MKRNFLHYLTIGLFVWCHHSEAQEPLRVYASQRQKSIGVAVSRVFFTYPVADSNYIPTLKREFNMVVADNAMKPFAMQPRQNKFRFAGADSLVNFAERNGMKVRGHCLIWHKQIPLWMNNNKLTRDELLKIMEKHITTIVSRYKGRIKEWDVVNEAIDTIAPYKLRGSIWMNKIGPDYIDSAFVYAHRADPDALLFYLDFNAEEMNAKSDAVFNMVKGLKSRGIPIHGVGLQCHFIVGEINANDIDKNIKRIDSLGLLANITELDIRLPAGQFDSEALKKQQAKDYGNMIGLCLRNKNCTSFVIWGLTDKYSWIPRFTKKASGSALIFDEHYNKKYAYYAIQDTLRNYSSPTVTKEK